MSSSLASVDMQDLARYECGPLEIEDRVDDVADFADAAKGMEVGHPLIGRRVVDGGLDDAGGHRVDPHAP